MATPYKRQPPRAFWKDAIADLAPADISGLGQPRQRLSGQSRIVTAGSCFAQHVARALKAKGFAYVDAEPAPPALPVEQRKQFGFDLFSARYGNVYTAAQLRQLVARAFKKFEPAETCWQNGSRFYDPFRPAIQPQGYSSREDLAADVAGHLHCVRLMFRKADTFIFTLGLTEGWRHRLDQAVYPVCPGVRDVGTFDAEKYEFVNYSFQSILRDLTWTFNFLLRKNPRLRFILTVSPVPLTATATDQHVLTATVHSKSVLRAVAGELSAKRTDTDYFPSYEMIAGHPFRGAFYEPGMQDVSADGVAFVMDAFLREFCDPVTPHTAQPAAVPDADDEDLVCEERVLETLRGK